MEAPKDIKFQIAILTSGALSSVAPDELPRIEWLECRKRDDSRLEFSRNGATAAVLDFESACSGLPNLIALIVIGDAQECESLKTRWAVCFPAVNLDFIWLAAFDMKALTHCAVSCLAQRLHQQRNFAGRAVLDLAMYRREFERLQHNFSRLEEYFSQHASQAPVILFEYPAAPDKLPAGASAESGALRLLQILPVDSLGVSGIAIHIRKKPKAGTSLRITLRAMESEQVFGAWSIDSAYAPTGWLHLALSHAIGEPSLSLLVMVDLPPGLGSTALALGQPHPYEEYRARVDGGDSCAAPLALRVFGGPPGVRVPGVIGAFAPTSARRPPVTFVPHEIYGGVYQVFPPADREQARFVIYDAASRSITVHPHEGGTMTIARLDLTAPVDAWRFSAHISLGHELANPTQFALLAIPVAKRGADADVIEHFDENSAWFSGWVNLSALQQKTLSVHIPTTERILSIYLMTRQAPDASPDFAWARFDGFEFSSRPKPAEWNLVAPRSNGAAEHPPGAIRTSNIPEPHTMPDVPGARTDVESP
jgi:hypothetical protein